MLVVSFSLVFYSLRERFGLSNGSVALSVSFNILFGAIALLAILFFLHVLTRSRSLRSVKSLSHWRNYIFLHILYLFFYKPVTDFSIYMHANVREGLEILAAIFGTRVLHCVFLFLASFPAFDCVFPQEINLKKCRGWLCVTLSSIWFLFAFSYLCCGDIIDFFGFTLILYTTLSISACRTAD